MRETNLAARVDIVAHGVSGQLTVRLATQYTILVGRTYFLYLPSLREAAKGIQMHNNGDPNDPAAHIRWLATTGFPSPGEDYFAASYFMIVSGDGLRFSGIWEGDIILVDRAAPLRHQSVVANMKDELPLHVIDRDGSTIRLLS